LTLEELPIEAVYETWAALGIVGVAAIGVAVFGERVDPSEFSWLPHPYFDSHFIPSKILELGMEVYRSHSHSVSSCKYHFVWCPKSSKAKLCVRRGISDPAQYRHPVLAVVKDDVRELFTETGDYFEHDILALEIADDHVHLFVQCDSKHSPADVARQFKSYSEKHISGVAGSGRSGTTWERLDRCRKKG